MFSLCDQNVEFLNLVVHTETGRLQRVNEIVLYNVTQRSRSIVVGIAARLEARDFFFLQNVYTGSRAPPNFLLLRSKAAGE